MEDIYSFDKYILGLCEVSDIVTPVNYGEQVRVTVFGAFTQMEGKT